MNNEPLRVLLIEDDSVDVEALQRALNRSAGNYTLVWVTTVLEGIAIHQQSPFEVIMTDLGLPDSFEMQAVEKLSHACPGTAVIALSGQNHEQLYIDAVSKGAENFLSKADLTPTTIHRCIQQSIQRNIQRCEIERLVHAVQDQKTVLEEQSGQLEEKNSHLKRLYESSQDFVNNVSHEFRTPLCVVKQYANLIGDGVVGPVSEEQCRMLRVIEDRVDDLNNMVDDMLDISRHESGLLAAKRDACHSSEVVTRLLPGLQQRAAIRGIQLSFIPDPTEAELYGDAEKISRTLINLIVNAIKFSAHGDTITIEVTPCDERREVKFLIKDSGPGIEPEHQKEIFSRFSQVETTLHQSIKGFGLGLSIAKELVSLNLGQMSLQSTVGVGSTFAFTVPYNEPNEIAARYLARLGAVENPGVVTLFSVKALALNSTPEMRRDVHQLLNYLVRSGDLLLRQSESDWSIILHADEDQAEMFVQRVNGEIESINRNRPQGPLPSIELQSQGSFCIGDALALTQQRFDRQHHQSAFRSNLSARQEGTIHAI